MNLAELLTGVIIDSRSQRDACARLPRIQRDDDWPWAPVLIEDRCPDCLPPRAVADMLVGCETCGGTETVMVTEAEAARRWRDRWETVVGSTRHAGATK